MPFLIPISCLSSLSILESSSLSKSFGLGANSVLDKLEETLVFQQFPRPELGAERNAKALGVGDDEKYSKTLEILTSYSVTRERLEFTQFHTILLELFFHWD